MSQTPIPALKHRNLAEAAVKTLHEIFAQNKFADKVVPALLAGNAKWGSKDRHALAFTIYEMVRHWRLICHCAGKPLLTKPTLAQVWQLLGVWHSMHQLPLPPFEEFALINTAHVLQQFEQINQLPRAVRYSMPDWLDQFIYAQLNQLWETEIAALNQPAPPVLRVNHIKTNLQQVLQTLEQLQIPVQTLPYAPDALALTTPKQVVKLPIYLNGWVEIQDAASQMVAPFLEAQKGMKIVDVCAGAGGKSLHLASLLQNKANIIAYDTDKTKLEQLKLRARRNGATCINTLPAKTLPTLLKKAFSNADRMLLDVPCTGLGTLKRHPDLKWKLTPTHITNLQTTQHNLLTLYLPMLKPGAIAVYATCSILPSENQQQVEQFLAQHKGSFELLAEQHISPSQFGFDGFYMAKIIRK